MSSVTYYTLTVKLSMDLQRTLYFETKEERDRWHNLLEIVNNPYGTFNTNYTSTGLVLGRGAFGSIEKYVCNRTGREVAVKKIEKFRDG